MSAVHAGRFAVTRPAAPGPHEPFPAGRPTVLSGWGRTTRSRAQLHQPTSRTDLARLLSGGGPSLLARGGGRAYGDAAQNAGGHVVDLRHLPRSALLDTSTGVLRVDGGATIAETLTRCLPAGWTLPVVPGTSHVTIGGAIAADVHGKNHVTAGSFASCVTSFALHTAGIARTVDRAHTADLFWATVGGMGLTGVISEATLQLERCRSTTFLSRSQRTDDLDATLDSLTAAACSGHAIAWLDPTAAPRRIGRGIVTGSRPTDSDGTAPVLPPRPARAIEWCPPWLTGLGVRAGSGVRWHAAHRAAHDHHEGLAQVLFPLDRLPTWNRQFGRFGLLQWQCAIPAGQEATLARILLAATSYPSRPRLVTLKALGPPSGAPLSFPLEGWTIALDWPAADLALTDELDALDHLVADAGGRIYLAKDARLDPHLVAALYPGLDSWRAVCDEVDPRGVHTSDLARRLNLRPRPARTTR